MSGRFCPSMALRKRNRLDHGAARVGRRELDRPQECGQEAAHLAVAGPQVLEVVIVERADQVARPGPRPG